MQKEKQENSWRNVDSSFASILFAYPQEQDNKGRENIIYFSFIFPLDGAKYA